MFKCNISYWTVCGHWGSQNSKWREKYFVTCPAKWKQVSVDIHFCSVHSLDVSNDYSVNQLMSVVF
jgi:hypothetical protein